MAVSPQTGPLRQVRIIEVGGMGPSPFAGMTLADMGASVIRIERPGGLGLFPGDPRDDVLNRGKRSICLDLKNPRSLVVVRELVKSADVLLEGHRPGVAERLGIGPSDCLGWNPALVYGRMTGWGQEGPLAMTAGHDINYIAITGALHAIGEAGGPPQIPVNLVGDFGGGGAYLVMGVLGALYEAARTRKGQVVDAAIVDGAAHLLAATHGMLNTRTWADERGVNTLDGGAPYYAVYETSDGRYMAIGSVEQKFYSQALDLLGVAIDPARQNDRESWPATRATISTAFAERTQEEWTKIFQGSDACVSPVVSMLEATENPHIKARGSVLSANGFTQPGLAPRFPQHESRVPHAPVAPGTHTVEVLSELGLDPSEFLRSGAAFEAS